MKKILIALLVVTGFLQISCSSDTVNNSPTINPVDVYVAGSKNNQACYWKNNQLEMLDSGGFLYTTASKIIISNGDVYVLGSGSNGTTASDFSVYWKNGVFTNLSTNLSITLNDSPKITDMDIAGNDVFFVGYAFTSISNYKLVYWKNNIPTIVESYNSNFLVENDKSKIKILNNDVYMNAPSNDINNPNFRVNGYYKNNNFTEINNSSLIGFAINNNEISIYGSYLLSNKIHNITTNTDINLGFANDSSIIDLCFDNNNMYYSNGNGIYKNGALIYELPSVVGINFPSIKEFTVINNNLYKIISGITNNQTIDVNGTIIQTSSTGEYFKSLYIVQN